jgi:hypothetical protein
MLGNRDAEKLGCWETGMLRNWDAGTLGYWEAGRSLCQKIAESCIACILVLDFIQSEDEHVSKNYINCK